MALWASYWTAVYARPSDRHSTYRRPGANSTSIGRMRSCTVIGAETATTTGVAGGRGLSCIMCRGATAGPTLDTPLFG